MATAISSRNDNLLSKKLEPKTTVPSCKANCSLSEECREKAVIYKPRLHLEALRNIMFGELEAKFKARYYNHDHSFRYREKRNATEFLKAFWNAKDSNREPVIKRSIADRTTA